MRRSSPTEFTVVLEGVADPAKKINVIKVVREITGLGLKEAKDLVEGAQAREGKPLQGQANNCKKKLEEGVRAVRLSKIFFERIRRGI